MNTFSLYFWTILYLFRSPLKLQNHSYCKLFIVFLYIVALQLVKTITCDKCNAKVGTLFLLDQSQLSF